MGNPNSTTYVNESVRQRPYRTPSTWRLCPDGYEVDPHSGVVRPPISHHIDPTVPALPSFTPSYRPSGWVPSGQPQSVINAFFKAYDSWVSLKNSSTWNTFAQQWADLKYLLNKTLSGTQTKVVKYYTEEFSLERLWQVGYTTPNWRPSTDDAVFNS